MYKWKWCKWCVSCMHVAVCKCVWYVSAYGVLFVCVSVVESSQQPAEEASPLGSKEADEEVNHRGDEDDACSKVVQVVESLLIGHHVQVPAGYNTQAYKHTRTDTQTHNFKCFKHFHPHRHIQVMHAYSHVHIGLLTMIPLKQTYRNAPIQTAVSHPQASV